MTQLLLPGVWREYGERQQTVQCFASSWWVRSYGCLIPTEAGTSSRGISSIAWFGEILLLASLSGSRPEFMVSQYSALSVRTRFLEDGVWQRIYVRKQTIYCQPKTSPWTD